jgi:hypothetical protein
MKKEERNGKRKEKKKRAQRWCLKPAILATKEAEIREDRSSRPAQHNGWWNGGSGRMPAPQA